MLYESNASLLYFLFHIKLVFDSYHLKMSFLSDTQFSSSIPKIRQKRKQEVIQYIGITSHRERLFRELQAQKGVQNLDQLEQPFAFFGRIHLQEQLGQAVDGIHVTIRRDPYHFCKGLCDCT